jgi:hypothetical protein
MIYSTSSFDKKAVMLNENRLAPDQEPKTTSRVVPHLPAGLEINPLDPPTCSIAGPFFFFVQQYCNSRRFSEELTFGFGRTKIGPLAASLVPIFLANRPNTHQRTEGLLQYSSTTFTIPSLNPSRRPANIPLRTISSTAGSSHHNSASLLGADEKPGRSSLSYSPDSADSDLSDWSDTGDLGEQLAEVEDPLKIRLRESLDREVFGWSSRRHKRPKRAKFQDDSFHNELKDNHAGFAKEDIEIPSPGPRKISRAENIIAFIMAGGEGQMHGLTGRPLVYVISE